MANESLKNLLAGRVNAAPAATAASTPAPAAAQPAVLADAGSPQANLKNVLGAFRASRGAAPLVNPPSAAAVIENKTAAEVAGAKDDPEEDAGPAVEPPTSKPAEVIEAENAKKTRRTAAVVQEELDVALAAIADLQKELNDRKAEAAISQGDLDKAHARAEKAEASEAQLREALVEAEANCNAAA